jgi:hypothetical protein
MNMQYRISSVKYPGRENLTIEELLDSKRRDFDSMSDPARKSVAILNFASWLHRMVKATIPKFSLDRGFEFCNVVRYGERQCLLQSVLISGMLQRAGADAGIEMVFKSIKGEISNNGHVCVLLKMPNGKDVIIDASDPDPLARQQGLMTRVNNDYMFVLPVYEGSSSMIIYYKDLYGHGRLMPSAVRTLDLLFVNSQFWYYRGERVPGGLLYGKDKTSSGLALAGANLETSVKLCPRNPLSLYMLGRVYLDQGDKETAKKLIGRAMFLYGEYGYVPDGPKEFWRLVR